MSKRHTPTSYGSHGFVRCDTCQQPWPCAYEHGWRDALTDAAGEAQAERADLQERNRPEYDRVIWNLAWMERRLRAEAARDE